LPNNLTPYYDSPYEAYLDGGAVTLERAERNHLPLSHLSAELQGLFYFARTNVYLAPPGMQTFNLHADSGDIIVLQLVGSKKWRLYNRTKTVEWPTIRMLRYGSLKKEAVGTPIQEVDLESGDMLYIPRGMSHEVITGSEASIHLTVSLATGELSWGALLEHTMRGFERDGLLRRLIDSAAKAQMRKALPPGVFHDARSAATLSEAKKEWMRHMSNVAEASFPLAHHLMQTNAKTYGQEKKQDVEQLTAHLGAGRRYLKLATSVMRVGILPKVEHPIRGTMEDGHGFSFDVHAYKELDFEKQDEESELGSRLERRVKILPQYEALHRYVYEKGAGIFKVGDLPGSDHFSKLAFVRVLMDRRVLAFASGGPDGIPAH